MRAIVFITIAAIVLTANGAPLLDNTASKEYDENILFMIKILCPSTNVVYLNEDGTEGAWPDLTTLKIDINDKTRQEIQDIYCPESGNGKDNEFTKYMMMDEPEDIDPISSTTLASTTTSQTVPSSSTVSNHENDFLSIIKYYCPNTQIINFNDNASEGITPLSISQTGLNFEQKEKLNKTIRAIHCPQLLSNNKDNGIMAVEYLANAPHESTTSASTTDANYEDELFFITQLFCPSTKLLYLNDDGTEGIIPPEYDLKLDDKLKQKIRETNCPEYLSVNKETFSTPFESTTAITTLLPIVVPTTDASINTSSMTVSDYENDLLYIISQLCPNTQIMYLNINGSKGIIPINNTEPIFELDGEIKQAFQESHCQALSDYIENISKIEEYSTVLFTEKTAIANTTLAPTIYSSTTTSTTTIAPSTTSTTTIAPSTTSTTMIAPSTTNNLVAKYEDDILFIMQLLCSSIEALYSNNNSSSKDGNMLIDQLGLDEKLKQEIEKLNCSEFSLKNENKTTNGSPSTIGSSVIPAITNTTETPITTSTEVAPTTTSTEVAPTTTSIEVAPATTSKMIAPTVGSTSIDTIVTTTSTTTGTTTVSYYRDLLLMIKQFCPNTKIVYLNSDDLEFANEINEMEPGSKTNDKLKEKIIKSHCPRFNNYEENKIKAKDSSTATSSGSTTVTTTSAPTTTIFTTTTIPTPTTPIPTTAIPFTTTTMNKLKISTTSYPSITTSGSASQTKPCHSKSVDCVLKNIVDNFLDFINGTVKSVVSCLKQ